MRASTDDGRTRTDPGGTPVSEQTPSQAEGERDDSTATEVERGAAGGTRRQAEAPRSTPSQAEGDRGDEENE
ncbi:hypothetical protein GCM10010365_18630 [Streptomyces poonensis]|uniref:Uncharacterized protein n=1 Tax=Streptomyces poonensis TaxID=68255 RepID=A0A918UF48_9ACTN|nr:hypothetical protein GCM10010365_18630 [Streptomyces poonensis]GLJ92149.1 hypothetical protein GCM10017589_47580 [Streptomyces poonensis]